MPQGSPCGTRAPASSTGASGAGNPAVDALLLAGDALDPVGTFDAARPRTRTEHHARAEAAHAAICDARAADGGIVAHLHAAVLGIDAVVIASCAGLDRTGSDRAAQDVTVVAADAAAEAVVTIPAAALEPALLQAGSGARGSEIQTGWLAGNRVVAVEHANVAVSALATALIAADGHIVAAAAKRGNLARHHEQGAHDPNRHAHRSRVSGMARGVNGDAAGDPDRGRIEDHTLQAAARAVAELIRRRAQSPASFGDARELRDVPVRLGVRGAG